MIGDGHKVQDQPIEKLTEIERLSDQDDATPYHCSIIDGVDLPQTVAKGFAQAVKEDA